MKTKMTIIPVLAASVLTMLPCASHACGLYSTQYYGSVEEITKKFENRAKLGSVNTAQFSSSGRQILAVWYQYDYDKKNLSVMRTFHYDHDKAMWKFFDSDYIEGSADLSVEMPQGQDVVIFRRANGEVAVKYSLAEIPAKKAPEKKG